MKPLLICLLSLLATYSYAQNSNYEMSDEVNIPQTGWDKVLMMRNGNTLLFHFEMRKGIVVKVFDKAHKEIASEKHTCDILDINALDKAWIVGAYDINGEAVLFFVQAYHNRNTLISLRINADNGKLIEEKAVIQSPSQSDNMDFTILKDKSSDSYYIICLRGLRFLHESKNEIIECNGRHEQIRHIPIDIDEKKFTDISLMGATVEPSGAICLSLFLSNPDVTSINHANEYNEGTTYEKDLSLYYLPKGGDHFIEKRIKLTNDIHPTYTISSYNSFANSINIALMTAKPEFYRNGIFSNKVVTRATLLCMIDESDLSSKYAWIDNDSINTALRSQTDTNNFYSGIPLGMFTNSNGITSIISEGYYGSYYSLDGDRRWPYTYLRGAGITRLNSNGEEIDGKYIPMAQTVQGTITARELRYRNEGKRLFKTNSSINLDQFTPIGNLISMTYTDQFVSLNNYSDEKNLFIVFNDAKENFDKTIAQGCDTIYNFEYTDACYLTMDKNKELVKKHLFDIPAKDESKASFLGGADFDDKTDTYATLVSCRKGKNITLKMAWCHLE